jgi:RND family efflux transporter MFP subunit
MYRSACLIATALLWSCTPPAPQGGPGAGHTMPPIPIGVATPIVRDLAVDREITGRLEAISLVELKPRVSGVVEKVLIRDGVEVKAGDLLLEIDAKPFLAAAAKAEADVAHAQARLHQAELQLSRGKQLVSEKVLSQQAYDDELTAVETAQADIAAARASLDAARLDLGYTKVLAPISGRIGKVITTVGNLVQGGGPVPATLIATILSVDPVYAVFDVDETTWHQVGPRLRASAAGGPAVPVQVGLNGETSFPHHGTVVFVDNQIDGTSGSIRVRASLDNPDRSLTPGAFARVQLELEAPKRTLLVNERAVMAKLTTRFVFVAAADGTFQFRPVQLGEAVDQYRVVLNGLAAEDKIAVNNFAKMFFPGTAQVPASMETLQFQPEPGAGVDSGKQPVPATGAKPVTEAKPATGAKP